MEERAAVAGRRVTLYTPLPRLTGPEGPRILPAEGSVDLLAVLESGTQENRKMHQTCAFPDSLSSRLFSSGNITTDPSGGSRPGASAPPLADPCAHQHPAHPACASRAPPVVADYPPPRPPAGFHSGPECAIFSTVPRLERVEGSDALCKRSTLSRRSSASGRTGGSRTRPSAATRATRRARSSTA